MKKLNERGINFYLSEGVFYNPNMQLSREISSAVLSKLGELRVLDAFSASGIRGIIYKKENPNIKEIDFLDYSKRAVENIRKNLELHSIEGNVIKEEFNKYICSTEKEYNFIELDPFGSPVPYLYNSIRHLSRQKISYLSATATDLQVLCGVQKKACEKFYQSISRNNHFCHETALRILLKKIAQTAAEFNLYITPIVSFYYRHQIKTIVKLNRDAEKAFRFLKEKTSYVYHNPETLETYETSKECEKCVGKLWNNEIHSTEILRRVIEEKEGRMGEKARKMIKTFIEENGFPPYFYSTHLIAKMLKSNPEKISKLKEKFKKIGEDFSPTHFSPEGFKTHAEISKIIKIIKGDK